MSVQHEINARFLKAMKAVDVTGVYVNGTGDIRHVFGKDITFSTYQHSIFDSVDNYSKKRLSHILSEEKVSGTTDIYLKVDQEADAKAYFLKYVRDDQGCWLIFIPYPDQYGKMVENMLEANSELTRLFEEKLSLEMELKLKVNELKIASITDPLTKLYNRQYFYEYLEERVSDTGWKSITLVMIDFNDFKKVNDAFGHKAGDQLLTQFSSMIKQHCHIGFRFGGDEFVIVSLNKTEENIKERLECINKLFKQHTKIVTLSYGLITVDQRDKEHLADKAMIDQLLKEADKRMYQHKSQTKQGDIHHR